MNRFLVSAKQQSTSTCPSFSCFMINPFKSTFLKLSESTAPISPIGNSKVLSFHPIKVVKICPPNSILNNNKNLQLEYSDVSHVIHKDDETYLKISWHRSKKDQILIIDQNKNKTYELHQQGKNQPGKHDDVLNNKFIEIPNHNRADWMYPSWTSGNILPVSSHANNNLLIINSFLFIHGSCGTSFGNYCAAYYDGIISFYEILSLSSKNTNTNTNNKPIYQFSFNKFKVGSMSMDNRFLILTSLNKKSFYIYDINKQLKDHYHETDYIIETIIPVVH